MSSGIEKSFISKEDSKCLYGIAILLMIFHHCFLDPARLNNAYISSWGAWGGIETRLAWQGKLCVAMYAFISGYALAKWSKTQSKTSLLDDYKKSLGQLLQFYSQFWIVFAIFVPIGVLFFDKQVSFRLIVRGMLYGEYYCGEWWYVRQYFNLMVLFPVIDFIVSGIKIDTIKNYCGLGLTAIVSVAILRMYYWNTFAGQVFVWCVNNFLGSYTYIFIISYLLSRFDIYEIIHDKIGQRSILSAVGVFAVFVIRYCYVTNPAQRNCDVLLVPFLIYFTVDLLHLLRGNSIVIRILTLLGRYSTYMWLTHAFYLYYYFQSLILFPKYSILIYIWSVFVSLVNAVVLDWIYKNIEKHVKKIFSSEIER